MFSKQKDIQLEFKQRFQNNFNSAKNSKKNEQELFACGVANTKPKNFKKQDWKGFQFLAVEITQRRQQQCLDALPKKQLHWDNTFASATAMLLQQAEAARLGGRSYYVSAATLEQ